MYAKITERFDIEKGKVGLPAAPLATVVQPVDVKMRGVEVCNPLSLGCQKQHKEQVKDPPANIYFIRLRGHCCLISPEYVERERAYLSQLCPRQI